MKAWTRRYRTRARGIDPPEVEETRQQEVRRWRRHLFELAQYDPLSVYGQPLCPDKSGAPTKTDIEERDESPTTQSDT